MLLYNLVEFHEAGCLSFHSCDVESENKQSKMSLNELFLRIYIQLFLLWYMRKLYKPMKFRTLQYKL